MSKKSRKIKRAKRAVKKANNWNFHVNIPHGIFPSEILKDLTRKNPVAFVTIKDNDVVTLPDELMHIKNILGMPVNDEYQYAVAIHYPLLNKAKTLDILPPVENMVYSDDVMGVYFECEREDFHAVIKWAKKVKYSEVPEDVRKDITVNVSLPRI